MKRKIALYGGSFDPPHLGHVMTITSVLNSEMVDEVWLIPTGKHRDKAHHASCDHRKAMVSIMLATMFGSRVQVHLNTVQIDKPWVMSSSANLIRTMESTHPSFRFFLVIGSDLIRDIPKWDDPKFLMQKNSFLAVRRLGDTVKKPIPPYVSLLDTNQGALTNISSSLVREMVRHGKSLEGIVPPAVISHIIRNRLYVGREKPLKVGDQKSLLYDGRYIRLVTKNGWEYVERTNCTAIVGIVAVTNTSKIIFVEQKRIPIGKSVIEFPAGLVGDTAQKNENMLIAAKRELLEETGYKANKWERLVEGPISSGLTSEKITFFLATGLRRVGCGGGDKSESIKIHEVPLCDVEKWLTKMKSKGCEVDPKVYAGLYFVRQKIDI